MKIPVKSSYSVHITEPVDFDKIDKMINIGGYTSVAQFDSDIVRLCQNSTRFFGTFSAEGKAAMSLRKAYESIKSDYHAALVEIVGESGASCFVPTEKVEE